MCITMSDSYCQHCILYMYTYISNGGQSVSQSDTYVIQHRGDYVHVSSVHVSSMVIQSVDFRFVNNFLIF